MGSWDCYCALCSGPLSIGFLRYGTNKVRELRKRRKRVEVQKARLAGKDVHEDNIESDDDEDVDVALMDAGNEQQDGRVEEDVVEDDDDGDSDYELITSSYSSSSSGIESIGCLDSELRSGSIDDVEVPPEPEKDDTFSQTSDLSIWEGWNPYHDKDQTDKLFNYEELHSYDPEELKVEDAKWIDRCRCLGFNPGARSVEKAFISGRGRYVDYGCFFVKKLGRDPIDTRQSDFACYHTFHSTESIAYPFHEACFAVLTRCLGYKNVKEIDKDVLYRVMASYAEDYGHNLSLNYGLDHECGQSWECMPGEEYSVCDPGPRVNFEETLQSMLPASLFTSASPPLSLAHQVRYDPLDALPYDILLSVFKDLSNEDMLSLMVASEHVMRLTRDTTFWKHMVHSRVIPWFWELDSLFTANNCHSAFDFKSLFLWLEKFTKPQFGMRGPLMGIANRRRIWTVCRQIAPLYQERLHPDDYPEPEDDEAQAILDGAICLHTPIVMYPQPNNPRNVSAQFIRSWGEIVHHSYDFDTYWNGDGALIGIAVAFGSYQRILGSSDGIPGKQLHIEAGDQIRAIKVGISEVRMFGQSQDRSHYETDMDAMPSGDSLIQGMTVTLKCGKSKDVRRTNAKNVRVFIVLQDMHLIGLTGQIAANGVISRLGLLQTFRPREEPSTKPSYEPAQQMLWSSSATSFPPYARDLPRHPIWAHPKYRLYTFSSPSPSHGSDNIPSDMLPYEVLRWAESSAQNHYPYRISCFQVAGGMASSGNKTWKVRDIAGLRAYGGYHPHVGSHGPVPSQAPEWNTVRNRSELDLLAQFKPYGEELYSHFEIDGPNGEKVTEVHISDDFRALKLVTNRKRECYWGDEGRINWHIKRAEKGEVIIGLSCCFGQLGGWSCSAKMHSHWKLSNLGVVTMRDDDEDTGS